MFDGMGSWFGLGVKGYHLGEMFAHVASLTAEIENIVEGSFDVEYAIGHSVAHFGFDVFIVFIVCIQNGLIFLRSFRVPVEYVE